MFFQGADLVYLRWKVRIMKNILFVASEATPFAKTGGLADVAGSLPKAIDKEYFDVRVIMPKYGCLKQSEALEYIGNFQMSFDWREMYVGLFRAVYDGVTYYFIDDEELFNTQSLYTDDTRFEIRRFAFFSKAALSALQTLNFRPDVIHCHDWQSGLVPVYLNEMFQDNPFYQGIKTVMTIHNLKFQGRWNLEETQSITGLPKRCFYSGALEYYNDANLLKGGLVYSDAITTVSPSYAEEIQNPFYGEGLDGLLRLRRNDLRGILNGIDTDVFDPANDPYIPYAFNAGNFRKEKIRNKTALQEELGLPVDKKAMMIGIVSRLTDQKGFDLIARVMEEILANDNVQFVILGTGETRYEDMFRYFDYQYHDKFSAHITYSEELSHKIYAASDAFLMPSLFEPCGLSQMMSLRYGTLPIVRETGGLRDSVQPYNEYTKEGTGFSFANYNAHEMMATIRYAEKIYYDNKRDWNKIVDRAMAADFSWKASALKYQEMYDWLTNGQ